MYKWFRQWFVEQLLWNKSYWAFSANASRSYSRTMKPLRLALLKIEWRIDVIISVLPTSCYNCWLNVVIYSFRSLRLANNSKRMWLDRKIMSSYISLSLPLIICCHTEVLSLSLSLSHSLTHSLSALGQYILQLISCIWVWHMTVLIMARRALIRLQISVTAAHNP